MRQLALMALAASAAWFPAVAAAQTVGDPGPEGVPDMRVQAAPPAGHSWREGAARTQRHEVRRGMHRVDPRGRIPGRRFAHIGRINRGAILPHFWFGPQFMIHNWGMYGFPQPRGGSRWVRYYDDALMVDRHGRVQDGRYGMDWDRYDDRWGYDDRGIPVYVGDGDYRPDDEDYEWAERNRGDERYGRGRGGYEHGDGHSCQNPCGGGYGRSGYGGYGYVWGPMVVTETTTTTTSAPIVETRTYYEYVEEEVRAAPRRTYRPPVRRAPRPAPPRPGERG